MKKLILFMAIFASVIRAKAQDPNILIGLNDAYGIKIKANFPGVNSSWARGYYLVNQDNTTNFFGLGMLGEVNNGIASPTFGWIGRDYNDIYMSFRPNGNVGIGTESPASKLEIATNSIYGDEIGALKIRSVSANQFLYASYLDSYSAGSLQVIKPGAAVQNLLLNPQGGNIGIGTTNPMARLHVQADANTSGAPANAQLFIGGATNPGMRLSLAYNTSSNYGEIQAQAYANAYAPIALNPNGGNILIGKAAQTNTAYKLDINGKARANEIVVNTTGADFVFENNYKLRPLAEVESFVKQNKHLPEIPTAKTMQQEGVGVSELQTKLLQKVEELTLYIIQQQKEIDELKKKLNK